MFKPLAASLLLLLALPSAAQTYVKGYTKSNGTYVAPHYKSKANNTVRDNYTYYGNKNPYTGTTGTNKYYNSFSSGYYRSR